MSPRTKIVATLGPATAQPELIRELALAGVSVFRLNFSHGRPPLHRESIHKIRHISAETGRPLAILQDLAGPKIRLGELPTPVGLRVGDEVKLGKTLPTTIDLAAQPVKPGHRILLDDGRVVLEATGTAGGDVRAKVLCGGTVTTGKGVNFPDTELNVPSFTEKDRADLEFGLEAGVDYVAVSFVRSAQDLVGPRTMLAGAKAKPLLIAKIEKPQALLNIESILTQSDGIMVARGDMGVELSPEKVPLAQKRLIHLANLAAKPVITATQMLESMVERQLPTRAEASDVANAIFDGTDAVMLSAETAVGKYPVAAVKMMARIADEVEPVVLKRSTPPGAEVQDGFGAATARAACELAERTGAAAIIVSTISGRTARFVAQRRPIPRIIALTPVEQTLRQLCLLWGIAPFLTPTYQTLDEIIAASERLVVEKSICKRGDTVVIVVGSLLTPASDSTIKVKTIS